MEQQAPHRHFHAKKNTPTQAAFHPNTPTLPPQRPPDGRTESPSAKHATASAPDGTRQAVYPKLLKLEHARK